MKSIVEEDGESKENDEEQIGNTDRNGQGGHDHAHSYHHFSGPVVGHHEEIVWKDKHGHHHHDYKAHPKYKYSYGVDDHHTKDHHGQKEHRDGEKSTFDIFYLKFSNLYFIILYYFIFR